MKIRFPKIQFKVKTNIIYSIDKPIYKHGKLLVLSNSRSMMIFKMSEISKFTFKCFEIQVII